MTEPEGSFYAPVLPVEKKEEKVEGYVEKANPVLKEYGKQIVSKKQFDFMKALIGVLIAGILIFGYMGLNDKFRSNISIPACPQPVACPESPAYPSCPENICNPTLNCGEVNIPSNLTLTLKNGTG